MAFQITETFTVRADIDRVWRYLIDPPRVVECLPGAELTGQQDDRTYLGAVKVKVGPVTAAYSGRAVLTEVDEAAHRVVISAEGRERGGAGSARMRLTSVVTPAGDGAQVSVEAELDIAGKIVQFGRGMIETVNAQLFAQFTACVRSTLERPAPLADAARTAAADPVATPPPAPADATRVAPPRVAEPVRVVPLLLSALGDWIARLLGLRRAGR